MLRSNIADVRPTWNARGMQNGTFSREVLTKATPALYLTHRQLITIRKERASASLVAAEAKKREQEEEKAARELIRKERAAKLAKNTLFHAEKRKAKQDADSKKAREKAIRKVRRGLKKADSSRDSREQECFDAGEQACGAVEALLLLNSA